MEPQLSLLVYGQITHTCATSSYSYVLFRNVSVSLSPEMLWKKQTDRRREHQCEDGTGQDGMGGGGRRKSEAPTWRPWTDESSVSGRDSEAAGLSFPSWRPEMPHQWMDLVLHISSTRSMVRSLGTRHREKQYRTHMTTLTSVFQSDSVTGKGWKERGMDGGRERRLWLTCSWWFYRRSGKVPPGWRCRGSPPGTVWCPHSPAPERVWGTQPKRKTIQIETSLQDVPNSTSLTS